MPERLSRPKVNTVRGVVFGALPSLAYILRSTNNLYKPVSPISVTDEGEWTLVTPVARPLIPDFPLLPVNDVKTSSLRLLGSIVSSLKGIPDTETWPMTSTSVGLYQHCFGNQDVFRVRAHELTDMWFSLPGSGGIVRSLEWHRDTLGVGHESVVLQVVGYSGHSSKPSQEDVWWVCVERYPDGDFATLSRNKDRVIRTSSEIRAEMEFPTGMAFAHVLRVLKIVHEVSPDYFVVGANCWFYASILVEMLDLAQGPNQDRVGRWIKGGSLGLTDHPMTKDINFKQYLEIQQRLVQPPPNVNSIMKMNQ
ncbi:hypothetical protein CTheo_6197 [Ceratobasidium theobromae]|uniref:Uncharacterized protein n=1 Tax=Ceratobasidium theobromae TaxID=1582974 RepID=A0A5N5QFZ2_9AGAM|nr:hypothetical protein CTheo_6197 [Ceratobasidium theobromae]